MKAGDIAEVHGANYVQESWLSEGRAELIMPAEEDETLPYVTVRNGDIIEGPFQRWEVEWQDEDGGVSCRWVRQEDIVEES